MNGDGDVVVNHLLQAVEGNVDPLNGEHGLEIGAVHSVKDESSKEPYTSNVTEQTSHWVPRHTC